MKIEITNGYVELSNSINRKIAKIYNQALFEGVIASQDKTPEMPMQNVENANDILVLNLIQKAVINEKETNVNEDFVESLDVNDFLKILTRCQEIIKENGVEKKS